MKPPCSQRLRSGGKVRQNRLPPGTAVCCALLLASAVAAQTAVPRFPSIEEIQRAAQPELHKRQPSAVPAPPLPAHANPSPPPAPPQAATQPAAGPAAPAAKDPRQEATARLMALLRQYGAQDALPPQALRGSLFVAVSFSMPPETLRRLIQQTTAAGGSVILRGLDGSPVKTRERIVRIVGEPVQAQRNQGQPGAPELALPASLQAMSIRVSPRMFERFDIREVPAFVLVSPAGSHDDCKAPDCAAWRDFVSVHGDVSLAYAMDAIARMKPAYRAPAEYFAQRAGSSPAPTQEKR